MANTGDYEVIVIGAGLGGLACAALLAAENVRVLVLERNARLGGRFSSYERDGFTVDWGTHMVTRCLEGPYAKLVKRLGLEGEPRFILIPRGNPPIIEFCGRRLPLPFPQWTLPTELALIPSRWRFTLRETAGAGIALWRMITDVGFTARRLDDRDFAAWLSGFLSPGRARSLLGSLPAPLFGIPYWEFSAGQAISAVQDWFTDACSGYPEGGSGAVASALARRFAARGPEREGR